MTSITVFVHADSATSDNIGMDVKALVDKMSKHVDVPKEILDGQLYKVTVTAYNFSLQQLELPFEEEK